MKIFSFICTYIAVPFLIFAYAVTQESAYEWILGILCTLFFLFMVVVTIVTSTSPVPLLVSEERIKLREKIQNKSLSANLHMVMSIVLALAIFFYVNNYIGVIYVGSLFMIQLLRLRLRKAAFTEK